VNSRNAFSISVDSTHYIDVLSLLFLNADFYYLLLSLSKHDSFVTMWTIPWR